MKVIPFIKSALVVSAFSFLAACGGGANAETDPANNVAPQITEDDAQAQLQNAKDDAMGAATKNHELRKEIFTTKKTLGMDTDTPAEKEEAAK